MPPQGQSGYGGGMPQGMPQQGYGGPPPQGGMPPGQGGYGAPPQPGGVPQQVVPTLTNP